jgi:signal transduction histidine kinase
VYAVLDRSLRQLGELVDAVLTADRLATRAEIKRERMDLAALLHDVVQETRPAGESRDVRITLDVEAPLVVDADRRLLGSAVGNLVGNAVKFSHAGSTVRVRAARDRDDVLLQVQDECGGLPPGNVDELFEPFVQRGDNRSGFGLGLAIRPSGDLRARWSGVGPERARQGMHVPGDAACGRRPEGLRGGAEHDSTPA